METYKVIFTNNKILSCTLAENVLDPDKPYYYHHKNGRLIYAMVRASSEAEALSIAVGIIHEVAEKIYGRDYIF